MLNKICFLIVLLFLINNLVKSDELYKNCADDFNCMEKKLIKSLDDYDQKDSIPIINDYLFLNKIHLNNQKVIQKSEGFFERCMRYLENHEIKIRFPQAESRSFHEESRRRRLKKIILPLLLLLKLKAAIIIPAVLSIIALISFKGLGVSLISLLIASASGLKSLLDSHYHASKVTYEVVPPIPHWSRSGLEGFPTTGYHTIA